MVMENPAAAQRVYIANFGKGNWLWPDCLRLSTIAVMDDTRLHGYWLRGDRAGYIAEAARSLRLASGESVTPPVASRWYNLNGILMQRAGDIWIHREKGELWWAESLDSGPVQSIVKEPASLDPEAQMVLYQKQVSGWSNRSRKGAQLLWEGLHPRAKEFLFSEGTFQRLSEDNAHYALAMIAGEPLAGWHERQDWRSRAETSKRGPADQFDARRLTMARMADSAYSAAAQSGSVTISIAKTKDVFFKDKFELEKFLSSLFDAQGGCCALTGLKLLTDRDQPNPDLRCSLDRIDSSGPYDRTNVQIVCRFANRWKSDSPNENFVSLLELIRSNT